MPVIKTMGTHNKGTIASGPPIREITYINKKMNGRSTIATRVADVKKSRKLSNSLTVLARAPDFSFLVERCKAQGWLLELPPSLHRQWQWFSGTDAQRRTELEAAWRDPHVDGIVYIGSGWGSARVLEDGFHFPRRSLWSLGFSDSSSLL